MEQPSYAPGLRLRSLRFITDDEIELVFDGIEADGRSFRVRRESTDAIVTFSFDAEFGRLYRGVPYVSAGHSLNRLVAQAWVARGDELPVGESWDGLRAAGEAAAETAWTLKQK